MKPAKEAKKYAKMFVNSTGLDQVPQALAELGAVEQLMAKSADFNGLLMNPAFSDEERAKALKAVADTAKMSDRVMQFVLLLTGTGVIAALSEVIRNATQIYLEKKKRARATVMTPVELSKEHLDRLKVSLKKLIDRDVDLDYVLDPSLLGGVMVKVGSTMYDSSIKGQLRLLKEELIKG
ncbi:MAG: ATP synthase F1 subunit delta [Nitrospiraceae bacterium]|nr:ATP synthase F1 subunit delta [Nitrospiraceae bacterium]